MRKEFLLIYLSLFLAYMTQAQTRGTKLGFIDMEYILKNVPNYTEAQNQLEQKAQKWKQDIEVKKNEINKLKEALNAEKALLTKGLIEERNSEIELLEKENIEYQQRLFGPNGTLMTQKLDLTKPIQDQVFSIVQDIAESKKYDFIFDKTSDLTMLFAAKRFDISDEIVRILNRTEKREQLTKKQLKAEEEKEAKEQAIAENSNLSERQKLLETKKLAREAIILAKKLAQEDKRNAAEEKKLKLISDRKDNINETNPSNAKSTPSTEKSIDKGAAALEAKKTQENQRAEALKIRQKAIEDKKKAAEERRNQILEERKAKAKATTSTPNTVVESQKQEAKPSESIAPVAETKENQLSTNAKKLEDRRKLAAENKKLQEEKRKQAIETKQTKNTGTISESTIKENEKIKDTIYKKVKDAIPISTAESPKSITDDVKLKQAEARAKSIEERKKAIEERRKKILEERETIKKANEEKLKTTKENINNN